MRRLISENLRSKLSVERGDPQFLERLNAVIERRHSEQFLTPGDLAEDLGINLRMLQRCLKRIGNTTPNAYLIAHRLTQAKVLLEKGHSVTSTALRVGFKNIAHFSLRYREHIGARPSHTLGLALGAAKYKLTFCTIIVFDDFVIEVIPEPDARIGPEEVKECHAFFQSLRRSSGILLNLRKPYLFEFGALTSIANSEFIRCLAVLTNTQTSTVTKFVVSYMESLETPVDCFLKRSKALDWLNSHKPE